MGKKLNLQLKKKFANLLEGEPDKNVYANLNNIHVRLAASQKASHRHRHLQPSHRRTTSQGNMEVNSYIYFPTSNILKLICSMMGCLL